MPENSAMTNATETPAVQNPLKVRADVIASNDPTSPDSPVPTAATPALPASVGALLREGREKLNLSAGDIATKLRMGLKQVTALENSEYASLPTGTFLRGFARNYAKAVALNADEVLALLEKNHSAAAAVKASSVVVPSQQNIKVPVPGGELATPYGQALAVGIVFLLLLAAVWYWWEYVFPYRGEGGRTKAVATQSIAIPQPAVTIESAVPASPLISAGAPAGNADESKGIAQASNESNDKAPNTPAAPIALPVPNPVATPVVEAAPVRTSPAVVPAGSAALGFTFNGESWVQVTDANGKIVLSRRFVAGDAEEVVGRAPFSVVIGNANSTRMAFNGREFDLVAHTRGAVARMTVK